MWLPSPSYLSVRLFVALYSRSSFFFGSVFDDPPKSREQIAREAAKEAWEAKQDELWWKNFWINAKKFGLAFVICVACCALIYFYAPKIWAYIRARTIVTKKELEKLRKDLPHFTKLSMQRYEELNAEKEKIRALEIQNHELRKQIEKLGAPAAEPIEAALKRMKERYGL